jgi:hypothetical protein
MSAPDGTKYWDGFPGGIVPESCRNFWKICEQVRFVILKYLAGRQLWDFGRVWFLANFQKHGWHFEGIATFWTRNLRRYLPQRTVPKFTSSIVKLSHWAGFLSAKFANYRLPVTRSVAEWLAQTVKSPRVTVGLSEELPILFDRHFGASVSRPDKFMRK